MGGFVEEALDVSLAGADERRRLRQRVRLPDLPRGQRRRDAHRARAGIRRRPSCWSATSRASGPGVGTIHLYIDARAPRHPDRRPAGRPRHLDIAEREAGAIADAQFVIDLSSFATEIALWERRSRAALAIARDGFDRLAEIDDAVILGQLAIPAVHAAADLAVAARAGRDEAGAAAAVDAARDVIDRYRASTARLTEPDALARHEIGWRMALCAAELARAVGRTTAATTGRRCDRPSRPPSAVPRGVRPVARGGGTRRSGRSGRGGRGAARGLGHRAAHRRALLVAPIDGLAAGCGSTSCRGRGGRSPR